MFIAHMTETEFPVTLIALCVGMVLGGMVVHFVLGKRFR